MTRTDPKHEMTEVTGPLGRGRACIGTDAFARLSRAQPRPHRCPLPYDTFEEEPRVLTKTHLSRLLRRVVAGVEIIISRAGMPVAKLIAVAPSILLIASSWRKLFLTV